MESPKRKWSAAALRLNRMDISDTRLSPLSCGIEAGALATEAIVSSPGTVSVRGDDLR
jgi:hypothetical protein